MGLIEFMRLIFAILLRGLSLLVVDYEPHHSTVTMMRQSLSEFFVRQKNRCTSLIVDYLKKSKRLLFDFWEPIQNRFRSRIVPTDAENTVMCYVAKNVSSDDTEEEESDDENSVDGGIQEGSGTKKPSKSSTSGASKPEDASRTSHKRKSGLVADIVAKRPKPSEKCPQITDPELQDLSTDREVESQGVGVPSVGLSSPSSSVLGLPTGKESWSIQTPPLGPIPSFSSVFGFPIGKIAWSNMRLPVELTGSAAHKTSDASVASNQDTRYTEESSTQGNVLDFDFGMLEDKTIEQRRPPMTFRASKSSRKTTPLYRPYSLSNERQDTQQGPLQSTVGETSRADEAMKPFSSASKTPDDKAQKRRSTTQLTPASDGAKPDSGDARTPVENHPMMVTALPPKLRRKIHILSKSVSVAASGESCARTRPRVPPITSEGLGIRIFDFVSNTGVLDESGQSPNPVPSEGLQSRMMDCVAGSRLLEESGQSPNPATPEDLGSPITGAVGISRIPDDSDQRPNPTASEDLGSRKVGAAGGSRLPDECYPEDESPMNYVPADDSNRDVQLAIYESLRCSSTSRREPEENIERGAEELFPWVAPKPLLFNEEASEYAEMLRNRSTANIKHVLSERDVPIDPRNVFRECTSTTSEYEPPTKRNYPGIAEEPLKVKKDARYQKRFYRKEPVKLPRKVGKALREGCFRESYADAGEEIALKKREEDHEGRIDDNEHQAYMRRYVRHVVKHKDDDDDNDNSSSSFKEDSPSSGSSQTPSPDSKNEQPAEPSKNEQPAEPPKTRFRMECTLDLDLLKKALVKFVEPMTLGKDIIFCRDQFGGFGEHMPRAKMSLAKISRHMRGFRVLSVEELLASLYELQFKYWTAYLERRRTTVFTDYEPCIALYTMPIARERSVPDGDYELVGDTLVMNTLGTENHPAIGGIIQVEYTAQPASSESETEDISCSVDNSVSKEVSIALESDTENSLKGSIDSSASTQVLEIVGYLDTRQVRNITTIHAEIHSAPETANIIETSEDLRNKCPDTENTRKSSIDSSESSQVLEIVGDLDVRQLWNIIIEHAEVHSMPETANISETSEDLHANNPNQDELEQIEEKKCVITPQIDLKSTTESRGGTSEGDEKSDIWQVNNLCPTDSDKQDESKTDSDVEKIELTETKRSLSEKIEEKASDCEIEEETSLSLISSKEMEKCGYQLPPPSGSVRLPGDISSLRSTALVEPELICLSDSDEQ